MMRTGCGTTSSTKARAVALSCTDLMRTSVARSARESNELKTIAAMKNEAILMPSGRSTMLAAVV